MLYVSHSPFINLIPSHIVCEKIQTFGLRRPYQMVSTIPSRMLYTLVVHCDTSLIIVWIAKPITSYHGGFYFWYSPQRFCLFHSPHHRWGIKHISHLKQKHVNSKDIIQNLTFSARFFRNIVYSRGFCKTPEASFNLNNYAVS